MLKCVCELTIYIVWYKSLTLLSRWTVFPYKGFLATARKELRRERTFHYKHINAGNVVLYRNFVNRLARVRKFSCEKKVWENFVKILDLFKFE